MATFATISVGTSATKLGVCGSDGTITLQNNGAATVYVAPTAAVSQANAVQVAAGATFSYKYAEQSSADTWYGLVASGSAAVSVLTP